MGFVMALWRFEKWFKQKGELKQRAAACNRMAQITFFFPSSPLAYLQKKAEAAHRILEGLGPQVELVSVTLAAGPAWERFLGGEGWWHPLCVCVCVSVRRKCAAGPDLLLAQHQGRKQSD